MQGWIKLLRKLLDWEWYTDIVVFKLFIHLLLTVNHQPKKWRGITIEKGATVTSIASLAVGSGLSEQQVRSALTKLQSTGEITKKSTNKNTVILVVNYSLYQSFEEPLEEIRQQANQQTDNNQPTIEQQSNNNQITTNKNEKNVNNDKNEENERNITTTSITGLRAKFDWSKYSERDLNEFFPYGICKELCLTIAETDLLYQTIPDAYVEKYLIKVQNYSCNDIFETIVTWALQDGVIDFSKAS